MKNPLIWINNKLNCFSSKGSSIYPPYRHTHPSVANGLSGIKSRPRSTNLQQLRQVVSVKCLSVDHFTDIWLELKPLKFELISRLSLLSLIDSVGAGVDVGSCADWWSSGAACTQFNVIHRDNHYYKRMKRISNSLWELSSVVFSAPTLVVPLDGAFEGAGTHIVH